MEGWAGDNPRTREDDIDPEVARYVRQSEDVIRKAQAKSETYAGNCEDCRHWRFSLMDAKCANPIVKLAAFNANNASHAQYLQECDYQRDTDTIWGPVLCGPRGTLFEKRSGPPTIFWAVMFVILIPPFLYFVL